MFGYLVAFLELAFFFSIFHPTLLEGAPAGALAVKDDDDEEKDEDEDEDNDEEKRKRRK